MTFGVPNQARLLVVSHAEEGRFIRLNQLPPGDETEEERSMKKADQGFDELRPEY
uniref:Uncharacterized protein n=1 Tax=Candidatus Kentrum sp. FW TaxID=2126338 RepID=A0A450T2Z3_9GAMM|nr:MAG: hypothetical protein BECKFW1821B_GA0114236_105813 [Candidatus Kentron sp. FW]